MNLKKTVLDIRDNFVLLIFFIGILLPLRLIFIEYIGDHWFGTFGVITAVMVFVGVMSEKDKLGNFGRIFIKQFTKLHRKKRRFIVYGQLALGLWLLITFIHATNYGYEFQDEIKKTLSQLEDEDIRTIGQIYDKALTEFKPEHIPLGVLALFYFYFFDYEIFAVAMATIDEISQGFYLHIATILLVEELEIIGLFTYYGIKIRRKHVQQATQ